MRFGIILILVFGWFAFSLRAQDVSPNDRPDLKFLDLRWYVQTLSWESRSKDVFEVKTGLPTSGTVDPRLIEKKTAKRFVYETTFKNKSGRKIKGIAWQYIFSDIETKTVLQRHKFVWLNEISKDRTKTIRGYSQLPPTSLVGAGDLEKNIRSQYGERVEVSCIVFADKSFWKNGDASEAECKSLREGLEREEKENRRIF